MCVTFLTFYPHPRSLLWIFLQAAKAINRPTTVSEWGPLSLTQKNAPEILVAVLQSRFISEHINFLNVEQWTLWEVRLCGCRCQSYAVFSALEDFLHATMAREWSAYSLDLRILATFCCKALSCCHICMVSISMLGAPLTYVRCGFLESTWSCLRPWITAGVPPAAIPPSSSGVCCALSGLWTNRNHSSCRNHTTP